ncbi:hypothetical protein [Flavobacterium sp. LC2016-12]|uniref:hypothetical protein n=1 Tax=Flavobacterium sp. LC2016-12 TaxID=2783794 RepID=UPI00188C035F|nr:hypothetical protein [Flavobacterium sp. LC2016-12]MBF4465155.1 hypothetical protein [Flavobacterium sp. LC2016-12]
MFPIKFEKQRRLILLFSLLIMTACQKVKNEDSQRIISDNYSIIVPSDFERTNNLNGLSKVQFQIKEEDLYFIVLEEPKKGFENAIRLKLHNSTADLTGYFKVVTNHFKEITKNFELNDFGRTKIDYCNAYLFSMSGIELENNKSVFYRFGIIEDNENYYQIMSWTNIKNKQKLIGKMDKIIHSFELR